MKKRLNLIRQKVSDHNLIKVLGVACSVAIIIGVVSLFKVDKLSKKMDFAQTMAQHVESFNILSRNNKRFATGFHMQIGKHVFMITNRHVCDANREVVHPELIQFEDHIEKIVAIDPIHDLCMTTSNRKEGLKLAATPAEAMEVITLIGFPRGIQKTVREGRIIGDEHISVSGMKGTFKMVSTQVSTPAYGGNSGSPVINAQGEVVGVLHAGNDWYPLEPFIVPHRYLEAFIFSVLLEIPYNSSLLEEAQEATTKADDKVINGSTLYGKSK